MRWFTAFFVAAATYAQTAPSPNVTTISFPAVSVPTLYGLGTGARGVGSLYPVKSSDNGRSWIPLYPFAAGTIQNTTAIAVDPSNTQVVYVGAQFNRGGIWKSIDGGLTWTQRSVGLPTNTDAVESLTVAANNTQVLYLMSAGVLYKSSDGAATWVLQGTMPRGRVALLPVTPVDGYLVARGGTTYRATDDGRVWNPRGRIAAPSGQADPNAISACLTVNTANPNIVFNCVHVDATSGVAGITGFHRSADGGVTWTNVLPTPQSNASTHILVDPRGNFVHLNMAFQEGYGRSTDGGVTFVRRSGSRPIAMDPRNPDTIYSEGAASISQDAGLTFMSLNATFRPTFRQPAAIITAEVESGQSSTISIPFTAEEIPFVVNGSASGAPWITVTNRTTANTEVQVQLSAAGLAAGTYDGNLNLTSTQSGTPSATFPVRLVVTPRLLDGPTYAATVVAGGGSATTLTQWPAGVPALGANLLLLNKVTTDSRGRLFISGNGRMRRLEADGTLVAVAGNGLSSPTTDGGQAIETAFPASITSMAIDAQDRVYLTYGSSIRVIENGIIRTEFKLGDPIDGDPDPFPTFFPKGLDFAPNGDLFVAASSRIIKVSAGQRRLTVHLTGPSGAFFEDVAVGPDGSLYFCDSMKHLVYRLRNGTLTVIAGTGVEGFNGDGPGTQVRLNRPLAVDVDAEGNVWFADSSNNRIRVISPDGIVRTVAGGGNVSTFTGSVGATDLSLSLPSDLTIDAQGNVYFANSSRLYRLTKDATPRPRAIQGSFVNAGSNVAKLSPGVLFSFYGANMATSTAVASGSPWPTVLGGASVRINGNLVPLFFASPTQINGQVPYEMSIGTTGRATVTVNGLASGEVTFTVSPSSPGILVFGDNRAVVVNPNGSVNTADTPAKPKDALVAYFTGTGVLDNAVATGVSAPNDPLSRPTLPVKIFVGQAEAPVLFLGLTPGYIGLGQANFEVPDLPPGDYPLTIRIGNEVSNGPVITIGPK